MRKDSSNVLFGKEFIISEATPKIGNNSIKLKQLNVANTDKTRSKCTRSQFLFQTLLTMTSRIVTMSIESVLCHRASSKVTYQQAIIRHHRGYITECSALSITR